MGGQRLLAVGPGAIEQCRVEHEERSDLVGALGGGGPGRVIAQPQVPSKPHKMMYRSRHRRRLYVAEPHLGRLSEVSGLRPFGDTGVWPDFRPYDARNGTQSVTSGP